MAIPTPVCLATTSVTKLITDTLPPPPVGAKPQKLPVQYGCFTTVPVHLDGQEWVVQNMPIHRWLLEGVFTVATLDAVLNVSNTKALQFVAPAGVPIDNQNKTAIVPVGKVKRGSKARQGKRIKFGIKGQLATGLTALIGTRKAPKPFGKLAYTSASVIMPSRCTNPQIGAWFSTHLPVARLGDITGGKVYTVKGTPIGIIDLSVPADFVKQFPSISATVTGQKLQSLADAPVVDY